MTLYDQLAKDGIEFEMEKAGLLFVFTSEEALQYTLDELRAMERYGYSSPPVLDGDSVRDAEPALTEAVVGGMLVESERPRASGAPNHWSLPPACGIRYEPEV